MTAISKMGKLFSYVLSGDNSAAPRGTPWNKARVWSQRQSYYVKPNQRHGSIGVEETGKLFQQEFSERENSNMPQFPGVAPASLSELPLKKNV